uniref:A-kinase anchor inhibitor 1 n=1 Tax=Rousettus aegyptiacus TaxID=9407 RepID=A0A7J8DEP7_ROUAE|nr:A-kinase anchor inhibitor 1 [Rousettus aegyptiacus]
MGQRAVGFRLLRWESFLLTLPPLKKWQSDPPGSSQPEERSEKPGNEPEEVKLQNASRQIVQNAILQAVRQVSQESRRREERARDSRGSFQLGVGELTKKHEKK